MVNMTWRFMIAKIQTQAQSMFRGKSIHSIVTERRVFTIFRSSTVSLSSSIYDYVEGQATHCIFLERSLD